MLRCTYVINMFAQRQNSIFHKQICGVRPVWHTTNNSNSSLMNFQTAIQMHIIRVTPNYRTIIQVRMYQTKIYINRRTGIFKHPWSHLNIHSIQLHFLTIAPIWGPETQNWIKINSQILNQSRLCHYLTHQKRDPTCVSNPAVQKSNN
jgi:hypothetical protein